MIIDPHKFQVNSVGPLTKYHRFYGDSISMDAADYATAGHCLSGGGYTTRVANAKNIVGEWNVQSSTFMEWHIAKVYEMTDVQSNESASYMGGINNIRWDGDQGATLEGMLAGGLVAILATHFAKAHRKLYRFTQTSGTWVVGAVVVPKYAGTVISSNTIGSVLTGTFTGDSCAISSYYNNLGTYGYEIRVDGILKKTVSTTNLSCVLSGGSSGAASVHAVLVTGCGAGDHTIEITIIAGSGTEYVHFDALFELPDFTDPYIQPFVWLQIPHANTNYWGTDTPPKDKGNNAVVDSCNLAMENAISFFKGYSQFGIVRTNSFYNADDPAQGSTADGPYALHPGCLGSQYIANGFNDIVESYTDQVQHTIVSQYLAGLVGAQPSADQIYNLNRVVLMMNDASMLNEIDLLAIIAGLSTDEQRLRPLITTGVTPMTSTDSLQNVGAAGNGSTYTNTKWKPATHGVKYTQNNSAIFCFNNATLEESKFMFGAWDGATKAVGLSPQAGGVFASMNTGIYQFNGIDIENARGTVGMIRTASNSTKLTKDSVIINVDTDASTALVDLEIYLNSLNLSDVANYLYSGQIGLIIAGSASIDHQRVDSIFRWYRRRSGFA